MDSPTLIEDPNVYELDVDALPARAAKKTSAKLAARMSTYEAYILALVPGKARVFKLADKETPRGLKLRIARAVKRLEKAGTLAFPVTVASAVLDGKEIVYARITPADAPQPKKRTPKEK